MTGTSSFLLSFAAIILIALVFLPNRWVNSKSAIFGQFVAWIVGLQFVVACSFAIAFAAGWLPVLHTALVPGTSDWPIAASIHYDGAASLMLALVSFVGWAICRYSIRYLDGENSQGRYFRWAAFTIGSVSLMVISGNLAMFVATWVLTSLGLNQLLLHYGNRKAAVRAAATKFTISRIGDAALIIAMVIVYSELKTLDFAELLAASKSLTSVSPLMNAACFLLVAGAAAKSAQFPFHTWLPQTMETPTPVSALMHAGIVNAGGYFVIRTSPLISTTPWALTALAMIGGFTACFAAVVMLTQTSVKKSLAYSTIAQMGFMMLQCGLGAFSAAMLHILAHSLYKAHAFLGSGSVLADETGPPTQKTMTQPVAWTTYAAVGSATIAFLALALVLFGADPINKPGGLLLGGLMSIALTHWIAQAIRSDSNAILIRATMVVACLCLAYAVSFVAIDKIVAGISGPSVTVPTWPVALLVLAGFGGLFGLHTALATGRGAATLNKWQIHAANGFYMESTLRRVFGSLVNH